MLRLFRYQCVYGCTSTSSDAKRAARLGKFAEDRPWCRMVKTQNLGQLPMCSPPAAVDHPRLASSRDVQLTSGYASLSCFPEAHSLCLFTPQNPTSASQQRLFPLCTLAFLISFDNLAKEQGEYIQTILLGFKRPHYASDLGAMGPSTGERKTVLLQLDLSTIMYGYPCT